MRKNSPLSLLLLSVVALLSLLASACYENQSGCLDPAAVNYQLDADKPCGDCCTFPSLRLRPLHRRVVNDTTVVTLALDSTFFDAQGQPYRIESIRFYLSDFRLSTLSGAIETVTDTIGVTVLPNSTRSVFTDDFLLLNAALNRTLEVGNWPRTDTYDALTFRFGLTEAANRIIPDSAPSGHPLNPEGDDFYLGAGIGYSLARISIFRDTAATAVPYVFHLTEADVNRDLSLPLPYVYAAVSGFNTRFNLQIDYAALFADLNILADSTVLKEKISNNLPNVFSVTDIVAESN